MSGKEKERKRRVTPDSQRVVGLNCLHVSFFFFFFKKAAQLVDTEGTRLKGHSSDLVLHLREVVGLMRDGLR